MWPPRVSLAVLPTRIQFLPHFTRSLGGPELFVKRDDETGAALSGNKVRKLEFLLADAKERECGVILTCGAVASNHCRATAIAARQLGMDSILFLRGEDPGDRDGNLLLDALVGAELRFITPEEYARRAEIMESAAQAERARGRRPYVIPEGGSNARGALGYVACVEELMGQAIPGREAWTRTARLEAAPGETAVLPEDAAMQPGGTAVLPAGGAPAERWDHIVAAVGSGGTLAGLLIGAKLHGLRSFIWAVNVCDSAEYFTARVLEIAGEFADLFPDVVAPIPRPLLSADEVHIIEGYKGPGYGRPSAEVLALIREAAREEGLFLDPVYTGKAFWGLLEEAHRGRFGTRGRILFLHTGGVFSLFPFRALLRRDD